MIKVILFDWGNTLMRDDPSRTDPMVTWEVVSAIPHAAETMKILSKSYRLCLATSAEISTEAQIRAALDRVELGQYLENIYCFENLGYRKPTREFYSAALTDLAVRPEEAVMVGDHFEADVTAPLKLGMKAVWFHEGDGEARSGPGYTTVYTLEALPEAIARLTAGQNR